MDTEYTTKGERGIAVTEVQVDSFTRPDVSYSVRLYHRANGDYFGGTCTCGAYVYGSGCTKHVAEAKTRLRAEGKGAPAHHAEYIHELCRRVFAKPRKGESAARSYDLLLEVYSYRYRSPELEAAAHARHGIVSGRFFGERGAA